ncbi:DM13 domain-containing protein [Actinoalloteichus hymeniacidonis]|nr:DM13 domain-containing protein [Actinoalloteichus hymeniacidonis]
MSLLRRPAVLVGAGVAMVALVLGLWAFQPWRLWTSNTIDEALPTIEPTSVSSFAESGPAAEPEAESDSDAASASETTEEPAPAPETPAEPIVLAGGEFVSQEHATSGTAEIIELADGSRIVRLTDLASSDGPDLRVAITDQEAGGDWFKYRDNRYHELGVLKGTHGNQNYEVPAELDLDGLSSVVIWCHRFSVAFGSAPVSL